MDAQNLIDVRRNLQRVEARRLERLEDAMTLDALEVERAPAAAFVERVEAQRAELTQGVEWVAVRTWAYKEKGKTVKIWASGTVKCVADGLQDTRSARAKKILPAGALLWGWDADPEYDEVAGEQWLILLPQKWNKHVQYAWRFDLSPPAAPGAGGAHAAARRVREDACETDEEYLTSDAEDMAEE